MRYARLPAMAIRPFDARYQGYGERDKRNALLTGEMGREIARKNALREPMGRYANAPGQFQRQQALGDIGKIDPATGMQMRRQMKAEDLAELKQWGNLLRNVNDERSYQAAVETGTRLGLDPGPLVGGDPRLGPRGYNPNLVQSIRDLAAGEDPYTLGPGQQRFRGSERIASVPPAAPKPGSEDRRAAFIINKLGMDPQTAAKMAADVIKTIPDQTGGVTVLDMAEGTSRYIPAGGAAITGTDGAPAPKAPEPMMAMEAADEGLGLYPWLQENLWNPVAGQFSKDLIDRNTVKARNALRGIREELIVALAKSGKPPVVEQERILQQLPSLGPGGSPGVAQPEFEELSAQLHRVLADDQAYANNPANPAKLRAEAANRARAVARVIRRIGVPQEAAPSPGPGNQNIDALLDKYAPR